MTPFKFRRLVSAPSAKGFFYMFNLVDTRINRTGSLLPISHEEKLKEIHSYSCLFVFIRGSSFFSD